MKPCNLGAQVRIGVALMLMYSLVQAKHVCQEITCSQVGTARWTALAGSPHGDVTLHSINCMVAISISFLTSKKSSLALRNGGASKPQKARTCQRY